MTAAACHKKRLVTHSVDQFSIAGGTVQQAVPVLPTDEVTACSMIQHNCHISLF